MNRKITLTQITLAWITVGAASRLLPHPVNVTPLAAMALLGGAYMSPRQSLILPLLPLAVSDLFLGLHATLPFVYISFLLTALLGQLLRENRSIGRVMGACLASSVLFFIVTNFGTWLTQNLYSRDFAGLTACYAAALPFFRNTILGDLVFTGLLFSMESVSLNAVNKRALATA